MTILEKLYKMNSDEQWDYFMCEMTQEEFTELRGNVPLEKFSINRIQPERSKREEDCTGKCSPDIPLILLDEWPNLFHPGSVKKVLSMRCSEHCSNTVRDK